MKHDMLMPSLLSNSSRGVCTTEPRLYYQFYSHDPQFTLRISSTLAELRYIQL